MDFRLGEKEKALKEEIRKFAMAELPNRKYAHGLAEESSDEDWALAMSMSKKLSQKGWLAMSWPKEYGGRGASCWEQFVYHQEAGYWRIPGTWMGASGINWVGPCLLLYGSEDQKKKYIPLIVSGEPDGIWCTGYSEPDAGSDFANLQTRAAKSGDVYIINGQKVWTSCAHRARWCWLAARTDPNARKKQHGISLFIVDMKSPGITVNPIVSYSGLHILNEVFFDNVRVPAANLVGAENRGWYYLMQALAFERTNAGAQLCGTSRRLLDEIVQYVKKKEPLSNNPLIRHRLAESAIDLETTKMFIYEATWKMSQGMALTYEAARNKAHHDLMMKKLTITGTQILGAYSQIEPRSQWSRLEDVLEEYWIYPGIAIAGGTKDIQRNIIAQFKLGLPKSY